MRTTAGSICGPRRSAIDSSMSTAGCTLRGVSARAWCSGITCTRKVGWQREPSMSNLTATHSV